MAIGDISCIVCGAPIDDSDDLPEWMGRFQAFYTVRESWGEAHLSGVGERRQFHDVIPLDLDQPMGVDISEIIVDDTWVEIYLMKESFGEKYPPNPPLHPQAIWGFPLHCSCLELLWAVNPRLSSCQAVQTLFHIFRSQPLRLLTIMDWAHDYGGIILSEPDASDLLPGEEAKLARFRPLAKAVYIQNPSGASILDIDLGCGERPRSREQNIRVVGSLTATDPFKLLPWELTLRIFAQLQSSDVCSLRRASRTCATGMLCDSFWRSRFHRGREFCHLYTVVKQLDTPGKWRLSYFNAKMSKENVVMVNRKRVWMLACNISDLAEQSLSFATNSRLVDKAPADTDLPTSSDSRQSWHHAASFICSLKQGFGMGSRILFEDCLALNSPITRMSASLSLINGRTYISGLKFTQECGKETNLGYLPSIPVGFTSQVFSNSSRSDLFVGFHVAMDARGIRGLRAIHDSGDLSPWFGDHNGLPKKRISVPKGDKILCIHGGFDALKLLSLSIMGSMGEESHLEEKPGRIEETRLWYPGSPPSNIESLVNDTYPQLDICRWLPLSSCMFGGNDGNILSQLESITMWSIDNSYVGEDSARIYGLQFHYGGELKPLMLGALPDPQALGCQSHSFKIESREGERITSVDVCRERYNCLLSFIFHTSKGRSAELPPGYASSLRDNELKIYELRPEYGEIVGLCAKLEHNVIFHTLGVLYTKPTQA